MSASRQTSEYAGVTAGHRGSIAIVVYSSVAARYADECVMRRYSYDVNMRRQRNATEGESCFMRRAACCGGRVRRYAPYGRACGVTRRMAMKMVRCQRVAGAASVFTNGDIQRLSNAARCHPRFCYNGGAVTTPRGSTLAEDNASHDAAITVQHVRSICPPSR